MMSAENRTNKFHNKYLKRKARVQRYTRRSQFNVLFSTAICQTVHVPVNRAEFQIEFVLTFRLTPFSVCTRINARV